MKSLTIDTKHHSIAKVLQKLRCFCLQACLSKNFNIKKCWNSVVVALIFSEFGYFLCPKLLLCFFLKNQGKNDKVPTFFYVKVFRCTQLLSIVKFLFLSDNLFSSFHVVKFLLVYAGSNDMSKQKKNLEKWHGFCFYILNHKSLIITAPQYT